MEKITFNHPKFEAIKLEKTRELTLLGEIFIQDYGVLHSEVVKKTALFFNISKEDATHQVEVWEKGDLYIECYNYDNKFYLTDDFFEACIKNKIYVSPELYNSDDDDNDSHKTKLGMIEEMTDEAFYNLVREKYYCSSDEQLQETVDYLIKNQIVITNPI